MFVHHNVDLAPVTAFGIHAIAESYVEVDSVDKLREAVAWARTNGVDFHVLGGGSNILVSGNVHGLVIRACLLERSSAVEGDVVTIRCGAGEEWHSVVTWTVEHDWGGLENLALIPGTVGAAPLQNIGAYGIEQSSCFVELEALDVLSGATIIITKDECNFGYRESIFKHEYCNRMIITSVTYRLSTNPTVHATYRDVVDELVARGCTQPHVKDIFDSVVAIRSRKLPDPNVIGNAGSFFKNPIVDGQTFARLHEENPTLASYPQPDGTYKLAAAWMIDQCGWKGHREGDAGVHDKQALVLVNHGNATGQQILDLSTRIQQSVQERFGVALEREINVW
ncbi:MAG: UDP-N-acetylmuramate dehydrogenase [Candidatus Kapabacteria bacterium]|nr:UDP-N-acetylmuramate dehydrogenase [Candidatus Kapabacteria bacterium]